MMFHVGNLSPETTRENLIEAFRAFGEVTSVTLPGERMKGGRAAGAHRGYGFVRMTDRAQATAARAALDGKPLQGRAISVRLASPPRTPEYVH